MALLVVVVVALALAAGFVAGREHGQQQLDARLVEAVSDKAPKVVLELRGGPFDGGSITLSPAIWERVPRCPVRATAGFYRVERQEPLRNGGAVVRCAWTPSGARERAS